ncbi:uncharacterized protein [Henckelia pumila]|uniref:uncharacterized protein n=1 Tax=Henckelia pumila TaxID=405737 RepID=UPI003C6E42E3
MGNQGRQPYNPYSNNYNPGWKNHPNLSWKPADPTANTSKPVEQKPSFEEIMMNYVAGTETRLRNQKAMFQKLETQMAQIATQLSTRPIGTLPSNTEPNPRGMNAIMVVTRSQYEGSEQKDEETIMDGPKNSDSKEYARGAEKSATKDALAQIPNYAKFLKDLLKNKKKLNDITQVAMNEECSAVLQNKLPPKYQDQGSFSIPCQIGNLSLKNVLCDLGSSINLMPYSLARKLDFVILDMNEDCEVPLILGRPFLAASSALVDVEKGELVLILNDERFSSPKELVPCKISIEVKHAVAGLI